MSVDARQRANMAWDILPCSLVQDFLPALGMVPASKDVIDLQHRESHQRLDRLAALHEYITERSSLAGEVTTAALLRLDKDPEVDPEMLATIQHQNSQVVYAGLCAVLAQAIEDGVLVLGKVPA